MLFIKLLFFSICGSILFIEGNAGLRHTIEAGSSAELYKFDNVVIENVERKETNNALTNVTSEIFSGSSFLDFDVMNANDSREFVDGLPFSKPKNTQNSTATPFDHNAITHNEGSLNLLDAELVPLLIKLSMVLEVDEDGAFLSNDQSNMISFYEDSFSELLVSSLHDSSVVLVWDKDDVVAEELDKSSVAVYDPGYPPSIVRVIQYECEQTCFLVKADIVLFVEPDANESETKSIVINSLYEMLTNG